MSNAEILNRSLNALRTSLAAQDAIGWKRTDDQVYELESAEDCVARGVVAAASWIIRAAAGNVNKCEAIITSNEIGRRSYVAAGLDVPAHIIHIAGCADAVATAAAVVADAANGVTHPRMTVGEAAFSNF